MQPLASRPRSEKQRRSPGRMGPSGARIRREVSGPHVSAGGASDGLVAGSFPSSLGRGDARVNARLAVRMAVHVAPPTRQVYVVRSEYEMRVGPAAKKTWRLDSARGLSGAVAQRADHRPSLAEALIRRTAELFVQHDVVDPCTAPAKRRCCPSRRIVTAPPAEVAPRGVGPHSGLHCELSYRTWSRLAVHAPVYSEALWARAGAATRAGHRLHKVTSTRARLDRRRTQRGRRGPSTERTSHGLAMGTI